MAYCTLDDIKKLISEETIVQLTDDEEQGVVNQSRVAEAVSQADGEIESYCQDRYEIPFSSVPVLIRKLSVDISIYNLYSRRLETIPQIRADRYKNAIRLLEGVQKGTVSISATETADAESANEAAIEAGTRIFTREKMKGF